MGLGDAIHDFWSSGRGVIRQAADRCLAVGHWSALPTASIDFRGGLARTEGGAGVNDALRFAEKDTADAYRWALVPTLPTDPGADRIAFWDESDNAFRYLSVDATDLSISGTTLALGSAPSFTDFTNANHDHGDADDGGTIPWGSVTGRPLVLTGSASPSAASSSSIDNCFSATYQNYLVVVRLSQSADAILGMRLRVAAADESGANTYYMNLYASSTGAPALAQSGTTGLTRFILAHAAGTKTDATYVITVSSPFATDETQITDAGSARVATPGAQTYAGAGFRNATTSYDGLTILPDSGDITGTIRVYGIGNS
jgi:hypothetical protein